MQVNKSINVKTCRDGMPKSLQNCPNVFIFLFLYVFDVNSVTAWLQLHLSPRRIFVSSVTTAPELKWH